MDVSMLRAAAMDTLMDKINSNDISAADLIKIVALESAEQASSVGVDFILKLVDDTGKDDEGSEA